MQNTLLLLSSVWVGLAEASAAKAHAYVRAAARRTIGTMPKSASKLAALSVHLDELRALRDTAGVRVGAASREGKMESRTEGMLRNLKVATSEGAVSTAMSALEICGMAGFRRDTPLQPRSSSS